MAAPGDALAAGCADALRRFLKRRRDTLCLLCGASCRRAIVALALPLVAEREEVPAAGVCRGCADAAGWPSCSWRDRLAAALLPVLRQGCGVDRCASSIRVVPPFAIDRSVGGLAATGSA
jgi:hypothetical protein